MGSRSGSASGELEETLTRHSWYKIDEVDGLTTAIAGSVGSSGISVTIDGNFGYSRLRRVEATTDETVAPDGTETVTNDDTDEYSLQTSTGSFTVTAAGSVGAVSLNMTMTAGFGSSREETRVTDDGTVTIYDLVQTSSTSNGWSMTIATALLQGTSGGGGQTTHTLERDLGSETLSGSASRWSSSTWTNVGTTTEIWTHTSANLVYHFMRTLPGGAWQQITYDSTVNSSHGHTQADGTTEVLWGFNDHFTTGNANLLYAPPPLVMSLPSFPDMADILDESPFLDTPAPQNPYITTGETADGGTWEMYDDGYKWRYRRWDAQGTILEDKEGLHHLSSTAGIYESIGIAQNAQQDSAPLNFDEEGEAVTPASGPGSGDLDGDTVPDRIDKDIDGDGLSNIRDRDDNGNGIPDALEQRRQRELRETVGRLFNEYYAGLSVSDRRAFLQKSAKDRFAAFGDFLRNKAQETVEAQEQAFFSISDDTATEVANGDKITISGLTAAKKRELLAFFKAIYGDEGMLLLRAYLRAGNTIAVENKWDFWWKMSDLEGVAKLRIQLDVELNPAEMAEHLFLRLEQALGAQGTRMRVALMQEMMLDGEDLDEQELALLMKSYEEALKSGASTAAFLAEMYITGIVEVTIGGQLVVVGHYTAEGEYASAVLASLPIMVYGKLYKIPKTLLGQLGLPDEVQRWLLRQALGKPPKPKMVAHHIIPLEAVDAFPNLFRKAAKSGFNINGANNGIWLKRIEHIGGHPVYNASVLLRINRIPKRLTPEKTAAELQKIIDQLRHAIENGKYGPWG